MPRHELAAFLHRGWRMDRRLTVTATASGVAGIRHEGADGLAPSRRRGRGYRLLTFFIATTWIWDGIHRRGLALAFYHVSEGGGGSPRGCRGERGGHWVEGEEGGG
jgi:hypothetical protein